MHPVLGSPSDKPAWLHNHGQCMQGGLLGSVYLVPGERRPAWKGPCGTAQASSSGVSPGTREVHAPLTARLSHVLVLGKHRLVVVALGTWAVNAVYLAPLPVAQAEPYAPRSSKYLT